ncbi:TonB-dependent receptor [Sphingomonas sp. TF3]|uniref:TonB-dependent receptor n=1 Tax=Sphingomonas sp. TF3 TaxID=2495580 RepID=UPI000F8980CD|nr:TonB-dependent receptor [Sphingomonas sp. TF3]RUN76529.1 TonB-dependent receptor [Sphingomonas sp. TF3]
MTYRTARRLALLCSAIAPATALAQTAPPAAPPAVSISDATSADIVVTAQRREQRLQDVPISVTVASGESIQKSGTTDLVSLAQRVPGVKLSTDPQSNHINIRGVGSGLNAGFEQSVGTFVDGVYRARSRTIQAGLFDVERVEVLNGPQTTFFGNNTIAGAINITSRKPSREFGYDAQALYSPSDGEYSGLAAITGPLSDTLSARAAVQVSGMNGYIYNDNLKLDEPHLRDVVGRVSFRWKPTDTFQSDLRVDYAHNRDRGSYSAEVTGCPPPAGYPAARGPCAVYLSQHGGAIDNTLDFRSLAGPSNFRLDMVEAEWTNRYDFGAVALNSITSFNHEKSSTFLNATPLPAFGVAGYYYNPFSQAEKYDSFAQELRLESQGGGWLQYVAGLYYSHGKLTSQSVSSLYGSPSVGAAGAPVTSAATPIETNRNLFQTDQTRSAFAQVTAKVSSALRINAGLRYTSVKKDASRSFIVGVGGPVASLADFVPLDAATQAKLVPLVAGNQAPFADPHTTYSKLMPSVSLQYDLVHTLTAYASFTKGFKAGGYSDSNGPAQFDSENVNSYEVGLKGSALDHKLFFTFDGFFEDFKGLQQALTTVGPTGANVTTVGNAASSVSKGIEFSATLKPSRYVSINLAAAYIDSYFKDYRTAGCTSLQVATLGSSCVQDLSGRATPFAPKFSISGGPSFVVPVGGRYQVRLDPTLFYSTSYFLTPTDDPIIAQKKYAQVDARIGFGPADKSWEVAVIGKNLNDAKVIASGSVLGTAPGLAYAVLQRARSVAVSFTLHR